MVLDIVKVGYLRTNCYLLKKEGKVLVVDPGDEYLKIQNKIGDNEEIIGVIITHNHPDHVGALEYFEGDIIYDYFNLEEGIHTIGPFTFEILHTPGHKSDSISIYFKEDKMMFTGDFLFRNTIGRTDFPTGSMQDMKESLKKVKVYDKDITVYPGHGMPTNLGYEIENNSYFNEV